MIGMESIYIPHLNRLPNSTQVVLVADRLPELDTLTPIQGEIKVTHQVTYLEITARVETIMTLTCDRCLSHYNYRLKLHTSELIWLQDTGSPHGSPLPDKDLESEDLVESLSPNGHFHPHVWLYEQLNLELPMRNLCNPKCPGISVTVETPSLRLTDDRWAALSALKDIQGNMG